MPSDVEVEVFNCLFPQAVARVAQARAKSRFHPRLHSSLFHFAFPNTNHQASSTLSRVRWLLL